MKKNRTIRIRSKVETSIFKVIADLITVESFLMFLHAFEVPQLFEKS